MRHSALCTVFASLLLGITGCASKTIVRPIARGQGVNGIVYALPKTVVSATVTVQRVSDTAGPYRGYTPCFFPDMQPSDWVKNITFSDSKSFKISNGTISTRGIADNTHMYIIDSGAGILHKKVLNAQLTEDGLLSSSDVENKDETVTFTVSTLKTIATIAGDVLSVSSGSEAAAATNNLKAILAKPPNQIPTEPISACSAVLEDAISKLDKEKTGKKEDRDEASAAFKQAQDDLQTLLGKLSASCDDKTSLQECDDKKRSAFENSDFNHAAAAFKILSDLENSRRDTLASWPQGNLNPDALKEVLSEYQDAEAKYMAYFLGGETTDVWAPAIDYSPASKPLTGRSCGEGENGATDLFLYVPDQGVCSIASPASGLNIPDIPDNFTAPAEACGNALHHVQLSLSCTARSQVALRVRGAERSNPDGEKVDAGDRSYYYRVPATVTASILDTAGTTKKTFGRNTVGLAQWGAIASLPASAGGSRNKYAVTLSSTTGALTNFAMDTDAVLESADLSGLESGTQAITNQLAAARQKKASKKDQQLESLQTQCKINAITKVNDPTLDCSSVLNSSDSSSSSNSSQ